LVDRLVSSMQAKRAGSGSGSNQPRRRFTTSGAAQWMDGSSASDHADEGVRQMASSRASLRTRRSISRRLHEHLPRLRHRQGATLHAVDPADVGTSNEKGSCKLVPVKVVDPEIFNPFVRRHTSLGKRETPQSSHRSGTPVGGYGHGWPGREPDFPHPGPD
jgi:hypothetical protein